LQRDFFEIAREDHRHLAVECLRFAAEAEDDRERQIFLEMADAWTVVAFEDPLVIEHVLPLASATSAPNGLREL
jgi:hypothetical protein